MSFVLTVFALLQTGAIDPARIAEIRRLNSERKAKIEHVVNAVRSGGPSPISGSASSNIQRLRQYAGCSPTSPRVTGIDWLGVIWDCPDGGSLKDVQSFFKFSGAEIVEVQIGPPPPSIRVVPHG